MSTIHKNYNLEFVNRVSENISFKTVGFSNPSSRDFTPILFYLKQIIYKDVIEDVLIEINNALMGQQFNDGIEIGSEQITVTISYVEIRDQGYVNNIPIAEFKSILEEYLIFLETPPVPGTRVS